MKQPNGFKEYGKKGCCPPEFDHVPNITGNPETDAMIMHNPSKPMCEKLADHISGDAYEVQNGYNAYTAKID